MVSSTSKPGGIEPALSSRRRRRSSVLALTTMAASLASSSAAEASSHAGQSTATRRRHGHRLLSIPSSPRRANEETEETNDDEFTIIDLLEFELRVSNIPSSGGGIATMKSVAVNPSPEMDLMLAHIHAVGTKAFQDSDVYGDRFEQWGMGEVSSGGVRVPWEPAAVGVAEPVAEPAAETVPADPNAGVEEAWASVAEAAADADAASVDEGTGPPELATAGSTAEPAAAAGAPAGRRLRGRRLLDVPPETAANSAAVATDADAQQASPAVATAGTAATGTATLSVQGGDVTFAGPVYWDRDPTSKELTDFLVSELSSDAELLTKLKPVVCTAEEMLGNGCDIELDIVASSYDVAAVEGAAPAVDNSEGTNGADDQPAKDTEPAIVDNGGEQAVAADPGQGGTGEATEPSDSGANGESNVGTTDPATDPAGTVAAVETGSPEGTIPQAKDGGSNDLKWIIPVAVGASLIAFALAALLLVRHKKRKRNNAIKMNATAESDDIAPDLLPPAQWANKAYDDITSAPVPGEGGKTAPSDEQQPKSKIDNILEEMSDGDSSFVSDSSAGGDASTATGLTGMTGLTGILGDGAGTSPTPLDDAARNESKLSKVSTDGAGNVVDRSDREEEEDRLGDIPKTIQKSSSAGATSGNVRKQEDFEDTYRTRSAMAKLNLKKDILHVGDETHDAPDEDREEEGGSTVVPGSEGAVGGGAADGMNINASAQAAGAATAGAGYGISRTISPKKSTSMMEKQRQKEKQWMRGLASGRGSGRSSRDNSGGEQRQVQKIPEESQSVNSQDLILPVGFRRSDSVDMRSGSSGSDESEEDYSNLV